VYTEKGKGKGTVADLNVRRALAIILPLVTLMAHAAAFLILEAVFADTWGTSWCARYNILVVVASAIGLLGAVQVCSSSTA